MTSSNTSDEPSDPRAPCIPAGRILDGGGTRDSACAGADQSGPLFDAGLGGEAGADTLTGGAGAERFIYTDAGFGRDTITDFNGGPGVGDVLEFSTAMFASWSALLAKTQQVGADTVITLTATDTLTLKNFSLPTFNQDDARFV